MTETIVSVAIEQGGLIVSQQPPARHDYLIRKMPEAMRPILPKQQGFLTSKGRFVGRYEAVLIAHAAGQIEKLQWPPELFSEDLW